MKSLRVIVGNMDSQSISTNMCDEDYVSFETAKLLKEKGYKGSFNGYYNNAGCVVDKPNTILKEPKYKYYERVSLQMAMKWLRENHNLHVDSSIYIDTDGDVEHEYDYTYWDWTIFNSKSGRMVAEPEIGCGRYDTYEQACDAGIKYCLENFF
jgi:hypothetical protein